MYYKELLEEVNKEGVVIGGHDPGTTLIAYLGRDKWFTSSLLFYLNMRFKALRFP